MLCETCERPAKCNTTNPVYSRKVSVLGVRCIGLHGLVMFGVPCSDFCLLVWV